MQTKLLSSLENGVALVGNYTVLVEGIIIKGKKRERGEEGKREKKERKREGERKEGNELYTGTWIQWFNFL
jgi:hypothetical protein